MSDADPPASGPSATDVLEELAGAVPRVLRRTRDQVGILATLVARLPCLAGRGAPGDGAAGDGTGAEAPDEVPHHEARQPIDVLRVMAEDPTGDDGRPDAHAGPETAPAEPEGPPPPDLADLPVPEYDSLAASQIVPRLTALSAEELELVRSYESAHRGRRTILNRVAQLRAS